MKSPIPDYLAEVLETCGANDEGVLADYIPPLAEADPDRLALALGTLDGEVYAVGDADLEFTIQSISKPFVYALALADHGLEAVLEKVDVEPSGEAFNEVSLEADSGRPLNPMINAGALTTHTLVGAPDLDEEARFERILAGLSAFAGRDLAVDEEIWQAELEVAHRNHAIAYMLRGHGVFALDPREVVRGYIRQCAVLVTVKDLAAMAATLANGGVQPFTGERIVSREVGRQVLSVMATSGMYDSAGDWLSTVGIPAKSGVSGGLIGALPGQVGIATFSPRLDEHGTSTRGVRICERLSSDMGMHLMEVPAPARSLVGRRTTLPNVDGAGDGESDGWTYELQGSINFVGMERALRSMVEDPPGETAVVLDLTRVHEVRDVGRRMLLEGVRRLVLDGHTVTLVDPDGLLAEPGTIDAGEGTEARVIDHR
ncbi:MAG: glutaminase [Nocardioides sp.]|nr:glutaminase [Nocardioides sp.]